MALLLNAIGATWGPNDGHSSISVDLEIGKEKDAWMPSAIRWGSAERMVGGAPDPAPEMMCTSVPWVKAKRNRDNTITITEVKLASLTFSYDDMGVAAGTMLWGNNFTYYVRSATNGWHWDEIFRWATNYYDYSHASYTQGLSPMARTVWSGTYTIGVGQSWTVDLARGIDGSGRVIGNRNATITMTNNYPKPQPSAPEMDLVCEANELNGNSVMIDAKGDWGYCDKQVDEASIKVYDSEAMSTPIKTADVASAIVYGLSPNTRYWVSATKSNGCLSSTANSSVVTVTPNALSDISPVKFDTVRIRLAVTMGGGEYQPSTAIFVKKCGEKDWTQKLVSATTSIEIVELSGLEAETCYEAKAETTTDAGTFTGSIMNFTTPKRGLCVANFTSIEPTVDENNYEVTAKICYSWETTKVPATIVVRYQVKDGYDKEWYSSEEFITNELTGNNCVTVRPLSPDQTVYQAYIHTDTGEATYDNQMEEFVTPISVKPDIRNCENFTYLTELLCQAVKRLYNGNKTIYANPLSQAMCDPYNDDPTVLALWTRALRLFHAMYCLVADMGEVRLSASKEGQYLVGEAGWQDIIKIIDENAGSENWKLATSNAIYQYIQEKIHEVWHYHGSVDVLAYELADLDAYPDANSAILTSENAIYRRVAGAWVKSIAEEDKIDDMGVWHIVYGSNTQAGHVQVGSAWYQWQGDWQPLDADVASFSKVIDAIWDKKDQAVYNEDGADRLHVETKDRLQFSCDDYPTTERSLVFITEPLHVPAPGYHEMQFETGEQATIIQNQQILDGAKAQRPEDPTRTGYVFNTWNDKATGQPFDWDTVVHQDYVVEAVWVPLAVTVTFDIGLAAGTAPADIHTIYGATINPLPDSTGFSLAGGNFLEWRRDGVPFTPATVVVKDTTLVAFYTMDEFAVTFHPENGEANTAAHLVYGSTPAKPSDPVKNGYIFMGWFTAPAGGIEYDFSTPIYGATDFYAQWVFYTCTISFDTAGGSSVRPRTVDYGQVATEPNPPRKTDKMFGWWMENGVRFDWTRPITSDHTLTARWLDIYTVKYQNSEGETLFPDTQVVEGDQFGLYYQEPTREGYVFDGWYDEDSKKWNRGDYVTKSMKLIALFTKEETNG